MTSSDPSSSSGASENDGDFQDRCQEALFRASEISGDEREKFLAGLAPIVAARVRQLLGSLDDVEQGFLDPEGLQAEVARAAADDSKNADPGSEGDLEETDPLLSPDLDVAENSIPGFQILRSIGEGGMGRVYLARQSPPLKRHVAIKFVQNEYLSLDLLRRFRLEQASNSLMDHPNVARVVGAGQTEAGTPFLAMEYVEGESICDFCDNKRLSIGERLDIFIQLCEGIQHAHSKGIIHRDIKPSNILVTEKSGQPIVKLIDFGIAKSMTLREHTPLEPMTRFGQVMGSPRYMSPEQAEGLQDRVDTRSDIYSLGVVLFELLTGSTPVSRDKAASLSQHELLNLIAKSEVPRPSIRVTQLGNDMTDVLDKRRSSRTRMMSDLRIELDWIALKALDADPASRYQTAAALAEDVSAFLRNDVVVATPPSRIYRLRKFVRRNAVAVIIAMIFLAIILSATGISLSLASWARSEAESANKEALRANAAERETAKQAIVLKRQRDQLVEAVTLGFTIIESRYNGNSTELLDVVREIQHQTPEEEPVESTPAMEQLSGVAPIDQRAFARMTIFQSLRGIKRLLVFTGTPNLDPEELSEIGEEARGVIEQLDRALEADPEFGMAYLIRAQLWTEAYPADKMTEFLIQGLGIDIPETSRVMSDWNRALDLMPRSTYAFSGRGFWNRKLGNQEEAASDFRMAIQLDPTFDMPYFGLGDTAADLKKDDEAIEYFLKGLRAPQRVGELLFPNRNSERVRHDIAVMTYNTQWDKEAKPIDQIYPAAIVQIFGAASEDLDMANDRTFRYVTDALRTGATDWNAVRTVLRRIDLPEASESFQQTRSWLENVLMLAETDPEATQWGELLGALKADSKRLYPAEISAEELRLTIDLILGGLSAEAPQRAKLERFFEDAYQSRVSAKSEQE